MLQREQVGDQEAEVGQQGCAVHDVGRREAVRRESEQRPFVARLRSFERIRGDLQGGEWGSRRQ